MAERMSYDQATDRAEQLLRGLEADFETNAASYEAGRGYIDRERLLAYLRRNDGANVELMRAVEAKSGDFIITDVAVAEAAATLARNADINSSGFIDTEEEFRAFDREYRAACIRLVGDAPTR